MTLIRMGISAKTTGTAKKARKHLQYEAGPESVLTKRNLQTKKFCQVCYAPMNLKSDRFGGESFMQCQVSAPPE